ncbi:MAG: hypothetical protein CML19_16475 [Pusillimonas sp.]|jgi:hypothetical protein|nr:hypothetical protein [Pusillimonas sp.]|tara:strand:- start:393 stop:620 length:228 start_codon:yes stop_codon:yes gene_type:complete
MEAFVIAIVFVTAWFLGAESRQVDPEPRAESEAVLIGDQIDDRECSVRICDQEYQLIIHRDLTVPVDQPVNKDGH